MDAPETSLLTGILAPSDQRDVMLLRWPRAPTFLTRRGSVFSADSDALSLRSGASHTDVEGVTEAQLQELVSFRSACKLTVRVRLLSPRYFHFGWTSVRPLLRVAGASLHCRRHCVCL